MSNPALSANTFRAEGRAVSQSDVMTLNGTVFKTAILLTILLTAAVVSWTLTLPQGADAADGGFANINPIAIPLVLVGCLGGFALAMVTCFVPRWAPVTSPFYAAFEGLALGVISAITEAQPKLHGVVLQAVLLTCGVLAVMLFLYATRIIRPTKYFVIGVTAATASIAILYLVVMVLRMLMPSTQIPFIHELFGNGLIGIGFSVFVVAIAALNLILDFGLIEGGVAQGAPKYMEWYGAFSLLVTLVWLYIEILRLLSKLRSRD